MLAPCNASRMRDTDKTLGASINVGELQACISNRGSVDNWGDFGHMLQAEFVKGGRIVILQVREVDVFFDIFIFGAQLGQAALHMDVGIKYRWNKTMFRRRWSYITHR